MISDLIHLCLWKMMREDIELPQHVNFSPVCVNQPIPFTPLRLNNKGRYDTENKITCAE
jgi:hypothetical protein